MGGGEGGLKARQGRRGMDVVAGPVVDALSASFAAMCAVTLTHPMDTVKTRIQTSQTKGFAALRNAVTQSGPGGLLAGVKPIILGSSMSSAIKFSTYHALTRAMLPLFPLQSVALLRASCASFASVLSSLIFVPWEGVKQRMQACAPAVSSLPSSVASSTALVTGRSSVREALWSTWRESGVKGIYRGWRATLLRDIPFTVIELVVYDTIKTIIRRKVGDRELDSKESFVVGGISGAVAGMMTCPVDVIKTRFMTGTIPSCGLRDGLRTIVQQEGLQALFRGVGPRIAIISPMTAVFFTVFELSRQTLRKKLAIQSPTPTTSH